MLQEPSFFDVFKLLVSRRNDPLSMFTYVKDYYGDNVLLKIGQLKIICAHDFELIDFVFREGSSDFIKGYGYDVLTPSMGSGLFTANGEEWKKKRRLSQPYFHSNKMESFIEIVNQCTETRMQTWGDQPIFLLKEMTKLTLDIICQSLFSSKLGSNLDELVEAITSIVEEANRHGTSGWKLLDFITGTPPVPLSSHLIKNIPGASSIRYKKAINSINEIASNIIIERIQKKDFGNDLLGGILKSYSENETLTEEKLLQEALDEVTTMLLVGHETTAASITWLLILIQNRIDIQEDIRHEFLSISENLNYDRLIKQSTLHKVWAETLRLYPPLWRISRQATKDIYFKDICIKKNTILAAFPYILHRDKRYWENPNEFNPERFENGISNPVDKMAYIPFGVGERVCIGRSFANVEALLIVPKILSKFKYFIHDVDRITPEALLSLRPKGLIETKVERRVTT